MIQVALMTNLVTSTLHDDIAVITINNPPVNALSQVVADGIDAAVAMAQNDPAVRGIVIAGAGRTFVAGADINALEGLAWGEGSGAPEMHDILGRLEDGPKPLVMALHGTTLGGGLELAMAGHYRVAVADAQMGQPEVNLGIIPGAEGTQRLPRLVGVEKAIEMCVTGKPIKAADALQAGLLDAIVDAPLVEGAVAFARAAAAAGRRTRAREEDPSQHGSAARRRRRHRRRRDAPLRRGLRPGTRHLLRLRQVRAVQGPDPRVLRRPRRGESTGRGQGHPARADYQGRDHRRRHDGRRHRDGVRERGSVRSEERRVGKESGCRLAREP